MQRIQDPTAGETLPATPSLSGPVGFMTGGSPGVVPATRVRAWWLNMIQEELMTLLAAAGVTPDTAGTEFTGVLRSLRALFGQHYSFDLSAPPSTPIAMAPRDTLTITFTHSPNIPLYVASSPGVYDIELVITSNNTTNADWYLKPNDAVYAFAFSDWVMNNSDRQMTAFGNATTAPTFVDMTAAPFMAGVPTGYTHTAQQAFLMDLFNGPSTSDGINSIGPLMLDMRVSTVTEAKLLRWHSAMSGGPSSGFGRWNDTTTPWTSLGTLVDINGNSLSGTALVKRLS